MLKVKETKPEVLRSIGTLKQQGRGLPSHSPQSINAAVALQEFKNPKMKHSLLFKELMIKMLAVQSKKYSSEELEGLLCFRGQLDVLVDFVPRMLDFCLESHKVTNALYVTVPCLRNYNLRERVENLQQTIDILETIELNFNTVQESPAFSIANVTSFIDKEIAETKKRIFIYDQEDIKPRLKEENYNFIERLNTEFQSYNSEFISL